MIVIRDHGHYDRVVAFAIATNQMPMLQKVLDYLDTYGSTWNHDNDGERTTRRTDGSRATLFPDYAPASFSFLIEKQREDGTWYMMFNGGLIYHGDPSGWGVSESHPTFSVRLVGDDNPWAVHS